MNAPVNAAFASILGKICPPAPKQPEVQGVLWRTVSYDGLLVDVYCDSDGDYSGMALHDDKRNVCGLMSDERVNEIERMAMQQMRG